MYGSRLREEEEEDDDDFAHVSSILDCSRYFLYIDSKTLRYSFDTCPCHLHIVLEISALTQW